MTASKSKGAARKTPNGLDSGLSVRVGGNDYELANFRVGVAPGGGGSGTHGASVPAYDG